VLYNRCDITNLGVFAAYETAVEVRVPRGDGQVLQQGVHTIGGPCEVVALQLRSDVRVPAHLSSTIQGLV
jgi:hypothetical protein